MISFGLISFTVLVWVSVHCEGEGCTANDSSTMLLLAQAALAQAPANALELQANALVSFGSISYQAF